MKKIITFMSFLLITVVLYSTEDIMSVFGSGSSLNDYEVTKISNLTFAGYENYELQIKKTDGSFINCDLSVVSDLTFTNLANTPLAPSSVTIAADSASVLIEWGAVAGALMYNVYRSEDPNTGFSILGYTSSESYTDETALSGNKYFYKITARSNAK